MQVNRDYLRARGGFLYRDPFADDRIEIHGAEGGVLFDRNGDGIKTGAGRVDAVTSLPALVSNGVYWQFTNPVTLTDAARQLPEVSGQSFLNGATARRQQALMARQRQLVRPIAKLERLSGNPVVPVRNNGVTLGNGAEIGLTSSSKDATQKYAFVRVSQHQIDLLEQSYEPFKKASYIGRFKQTRLDRYNDRILITVSNQGEGALNFSSINVLIDSRYKGNAATALPQKPPYILAGDASGHCLCRRGGQVVGFKLT